jgi:hypothetical protein
MPMQDESSSPDVMRCKQCGGALTSQDRVASMSGSIMGDENTDSYFACPACGFYTVLHWWDNFTGVETLSSSGPLDKQEGDALIEIIKGCSRPWDKKCRCKSHLAYFRDSLD